MKESTEGQGRVEYLRSVDEGERWKIGDSGKVKGTTDGGRIDFL